MKKLNVTLFVIFLLALVGCSNSIGEDTHKNMLKVSQAKEVNNKEKEPQVVGIAYNSITEYHDIIGENLKTTILKISSKDGNSYLDMDIKLSPKLKNMMLNTKNKFYFTFNEVEGHDKLSQIVINEPNYIEGNLEKISSTNILHLTQKKKLKQNPSSEEMKKITSPENWELVVLNEKYEMVAVIIGLELNMIQP